MLYLFLEAANKGRNIAKNKVKESLLNLFVVLDPLQPRNRKLNIKISRGNMMKKTKRDRKENLFYINM